MLDLETKEASPVRQSRFGEFDAIFSPDGRWIAYTCIESGTNQVYVMPFPDKGRRWQVSTGDVGGLFPSWTTSGEIIFQTGPGDLMTAKVSTNSGTFGVEGVNKLFQTAPTEPGGAKWSCSPDGKTFLAIPNSLSKVDREMKLTFNWPVVLDK